MKRTFLCIAILITSTVFASQPFEPTDLKLQALDAFNRGISSVALKGPSGDPGPRECSTISPRNNLWRTLPVLVTGLQLSELTNTRPDPWDWPPSKWPEYLAPNASIPYSSQWWFGTPDSQGILRNSVRSWLLNCRSEIWAGNVPPKWEAIVNNTIDHVHAWIFIPYQYSPQELVTLNAFKCRTLACKKLNIDSTPIYAPNNISEHWYEFIGKVSWLSSPLTNSSIRRTLEKQLKMLAELEFGYTTRCPNNEPWPCTSGPMMALWKQWAQNPSYPGDELCSPCPACVSCNSCCKPCNPCEPQQSMIFESKSMSPPVVRPKILDHESSKSLLISTTITFSSVPKKGESFTPGWIMGGTSPKHDVIYANIKHEDDHWKVVFRTGPNRFRLKLKLVRKIPLVFRIGIPYTFIYKRTAKESTSFEIHDNGSTILSLTHNHDALPFKVHKADIGHDGEEPNEVFTHGFVETKASPIN